MSNNKQNKNGKEFYIALGLCVIAIGVAAYITYGTPSSNNITDDQTISSQQEESTQQADTNISGVTEDSSSETSSKESSKAVKETDADINAEDNNAIGKVVYPVGKNITKEFSDAQPIYSTTLNDWRTHEGIDFTAEKGASVVSATDGVVKEVKDDDMYGKTVVIKHTGDFEAYYCGLGDTVLVNPGDTVITGQEIGSIKKVPCESLDEDHLHFGLKMNDNWINPMELLSKAG